MDLCFQTNHAQPSFNSRLREIVCALPVPWEEILLIADHHKHGQDFSLHSHSIVPGGFDVMSYTTRLMPFTSLTMRLEMVLRTSCGRSTQSAVMPSSEFTARMAQVYAYVRMSPMTPTDITGSSTANDCQIL